MELTITITGVCDGGNHVFVDVETADKARQEVFDTRDLLAESGDLRVDTERNAILREVRRQAKAANVKSFAQLKTLCTKLSLSL